MSHIETPATAEEIATCYSVMAELRPHLTQVAFVEQVVDQMATQHYQLAVVMEDGVPVAVAGYRLGRNLSWGYFLYVDDLVTAAAHRSGGYGGMLLDWLVEEGRRQGCAEFHLDSGVQRFAAHRFYLTKRMDITAHHFGMKL